MSAETSTKQVELQPILENGEPAFTKEGSSTSADDEAKSFRLKPAYRTIAKATILISTWYLLSTMLSMWNRKLLGKEHGGVFDLGPFPAPLLMSSLQFAGQIFLARLVLRMGWAKRHIKDSMSWRQYLRQVVPNGVSTGLDIGLSNFSLSLITLSFYTMCKSTTPIFLLCFCFLWGIEKPSWHLAAVVGVISLGLTLLVKGETQFDMLGFVLVMIASMLSGLRWTITQVLLQGTGGADGHSVNGGPVEVLHQLMPVMSVTVGFMSLVAEQLWNVIPVSPYFTSPEALGVTACCILFGGLIAFLMVWVEFSVIAETSALTFMVAGTFKEIVTVVSAVIFLGDDFGFINAVGLVVLICGAGLFNYSKYRKMMEKEPRLGRASGGSGTQYSPLDRTEKGEVVVLPATPKSALEGAAYTNGGQLSMAHRRDTASLPVLPTERAAAP